MKNAKKILALLMLVPLIFTLFCGFHGKQSLDPFEMPKEFDTSREYEITFWAKNDTNKTQVEIYEKAIADFEKLYPNIHVTMRKFTDYKKIYNDVITNIPTQTTPNVCISYPDHVATYMTGTNVMASLDELMADKKYGLGGSELKFDGPTEDEIIEKFLNECKIDGVTYCLPYMRSTECLYINKTYVERMGYTIPDFPTWDWIWEVSDAATAQNEDGTYKVNGQKVMIPFIYKSTDNMMISMLKQLGGDYSTSEGDILIFNETTKDILNTICEHSEKRSFSTFGISSYPGNFINAGQCLFGIDSTAGATWMGPLAVNGHQDISEDSLVDFEMAVRPIPQYDIDNPFMISQGPSVCVFNKSDPQEVLASWLFAQFLLTDDVQIEYSQTEGYAPVTEKARSNPKYIDYLNRSGENNDLYYYVKIDATKVLLNNTDNTFITPVFNGSASLREAAGAMIEDVAYAPTRKKTVDDTYIENVFVNMQKLYKLDQLGGSVAMKKDLGPLPATSKALLWSLLGAWICIAIYVLSKYNKGVHKAQKG